MTIRNGLHTVTLIVLSAGIVFVGVLFLRSRSSGIEIPVMKVISFDEPVQCISILRKNQIVACTGTSAIVFSETGEVLSDISFESTLFDAFPANNGSTLIAVESSGSVWEISLDLDGREVTRSKITSLPGVPNAIASLKDGAYILCLDGNKILLWSREDDSLEHIDSANDMVRSAVYDPITDAIYYGTGSPFLPSADDHSIRRYDIKEQAVAWAVAANDVCGLEIRQDGTLLSSEENRIRLIDTSNGREVSTTGEIVKSHLPYILDPIYDGKLAIHIGDGRGYTVHSINEANEFEDVGRVNASGLLSAISESGKMYILDLSRVTILVADLMLGTQN